jgi:putative hydrolase of the HAD superfamily
VIRAVLFDFGGVILSSPFEAFAHYEQLNGLPDGLIRQLNATNHENNAWAHLERGGVDIEGFAELFEDEARQAGYDVDAHAILSLLSGEIRPEMVEAVRRIKERGLGLAVLTNNFAPPPGAERSLERESALAEVMALFDHVVESSKVGVRKPDPRFYELACDTVGIEPSEAVFLDDLGINLKPAKAMGMTTIKVLSAEQALTELEGVLGFPLREVP